MKKFFRKLYRRLPLRIVYSIAQLPFVNLQRFKDIRPYFLQKEMQTYPAKYPNQPDAQFKVIVYGLRTFMTHNLAVFEKVFSDAFRHHGAAVLNLLCENLWSSCDGADEHTSDRELCFKCKRERPYFKRYFPNDFRKFSAGTYFF